MFEQIVTRPPRRAIKSVLIVGSAVVHAVVVAGIVVAGMWKVDLLPLGPDRADIVLNVPKPPSGAAQLPAGQAQTVIKPHIIKVRPKDAVQPSIVKPDSPPTVAVSTTAAIGTGLGTGDTAIDGDETDGPPCPAEPCVIGGDPVDPVEPAVTTPPPVKKPDTVRPDLARGLRTSGDEQIFPPRTVQLDMVHAGKDRVQGTFQLCVDERGSVSSVRQLKSTGYQAYDSELIDAMRRWRYRPYLVAGEPAPMCTVQVFVYRIKP